MRRLLPMIALILLATACVDREAERRAAMERAAAQAELAASAGARQVAEVLASGKVEIAYAYAQDVQQRYPNTAAGRQLAAQLPQLKVDADRLREARRLESLWTYHAVDDEEAGGTVYTAYIHATANDSAGPAPDLRLVLRRHPQWGQSVYLLMEGGDFACQDECRVPMADDDAAAVATLVSRAKGNEPPALFIEDDATALKRIDTAHRITLELPLADQRKRGYLFEVSALDMRRLGPPAKAQP